MNEPTTEPIKLYVWQDVLTDWTSGMVCILAHNLEEAKQVAERDFEDYIVEGFFGKPYTVHTEPFGVYVSGGG